MSELTLEALGYRADEAALARQIHDLTHTPQERAEPLRQILACVRAPEQRAVAEKETAT